MFNYVATVNSFLHLGRKGREDFGFVGTGGLIIEGESHNLRTSSLLAKGTDGKTLLMIACTANNLKQVRYFIECGADPLIECNGITAFEYACNQTSHKLLEVLFSSKTDINRVAQNHLHTLCYAVTKENTLKHIELLLQHSADPDGNVTEAHRGKTPLMTCCLPAHKNSERYIKLLTQKGANVNLQDEQGNTALHCAMLSQDTDLIKVLLDLGADPNILNDNKVSAFEICSLAEQCKTELAVPLSEFIHQAMQRGAWFAAIQVYNQNKEKIATELESFAPRVSDKYRYTCSALEKSLDSSVKDTGLPTKELPLVKALLCGDYQAVELLLQVHPFDILSITEDREVFASIKSSSGYRNSEQIRTLYDEMLEYSRKEFLTKVTVKEPAKDEDSDFLEVNLVG
ncbi:hypothetical protein SOPP22_04435 [Shewanella sp. OPT22]|nr:hypothetical protein SOPP22_04435 [Shewanella sp. OPT22]